jgi:hypothetical protein
MMNQTAGLHQPGFEQAQLTQHNNSQYDVIQDMTREAGGP